MLLIGLYKRNRMRFSITVPQIKTVAATTAAISEGGWVDSVYPAAGSPKSPRSPTLSQSRFFTEVALRR